MDTSHYPDSPPHPPNEDSYEAASQSTADFIQNVAPLQAHKRKGRRRKTLFLIILILLIAGGAGAYFYLKPAEKKAPQQAAPSPAPQPADTQETLSERYVSQDLRLALEHPKSWKVDAAAPGRLTLTSPLVKLSDADKDQTDSKVVITILSAGSDPAGFTANNASATIDAEKIAYAAPSQNQRKETHLSFISFGASTGIDAIFITGDAGYQAGQAVPKTDVARADPIISVTFQKCTGAACTDKLSISPDAWTAAAILQTAKSILQSLTIN